MAFFTNAYRHFFLSNQFLNLISLRQLDMQVLQLTRRARPLWSAPTWLWGLWAGRSAALQQRWVPTSLCSPPGPVPALVPACLLMMEGISAPEPATMKNNAKGRKESAPQGAVWGGGGRWGWDGSGGGGVWRGVAEEGRGPLLVVILLFLQGWNGY